MKFLNKTFSLLTLAFMLTISLFTAPRLEAAQSVTTISALTQTNRLLFTNRVQITSMIIANPSEQPLTIRMIDSPNTFAIYTNGAYTGAVSFMTNIITTYTNYSGWIQTNTNRAVFSSTVDVVANTTAPRNTMGVFTVGPTNTLVYTPTEVFGNSFGILITNTAITNAVITINYIE
jgi:hypothetical protein